MNATTTTATDERAFTAAVDLRADARRRRMATTTGDRLYRLYVVLLLISPVTYLVVVALQSTPRAPDGVVQVLAARLTVAVPLALLGVGISALRLAAWTGPVVVSRADIVWLLSLPFPRSRLIRPRLGRALVVGTIAGAVLGGLATLPYHLTVGLPTAAVAELTRMALAAWGGGALYGLLLVGAGWAVERHDTLARVVMRGGGLLLVAIAAGTITSLVGPPPPTWLAVLALSSGPWGWASAPAFAATSAATVEVGWGLAALVALGLAAVGVARHGLRHAGDIALEELRRRAATSAQVTAAAVYFADFRSAAQARDRVVRALVGRSRRRLPMPSRPALLAPWIGSTILLRQPRRLGQALLWLVVAACLAGLGLEGLDAPAEQSSSRVALLALAPVAAYPAAGLLIEPLRVELEQRFGLRMLPQSLPSVGLRHLLTPTAAMWLLGMAAGIGTAAVGFLPPAAVALAPIVVPLASVGLVLSAAFVASGPPPDDMLLYLGEPGMTLLVAHMVRGPQLAAIIVGVPLLVTTAVIAESGNWVPPVIGWTLWTVLVGAGLAAWIQKRLNKAHG